MVDLGVDEAVVRCDRLEARNFAHRQRDIEPRTPITSVPSLDVMKDRQRERRLTLLDGSAHQRENPKVIFALRLSETGARQRNPMVLVEVDPLQRLR